MCISRKCGLIMFAIFVSAAVVGCNSSPNRSSEDAGGAQATEPSNEVDDEITAALAELPEEDRLAAKAQKFCAVMEDSQLGSMGAPVKVIVDGQPVFLCCAGCEEKALANPSKTLATVEKLKVANQSQ